MSRFVLTVAHDLGSFFLQDAEMGGQEELGVEVDWLVVDGLGQAGLLEALEALCQVVLDGCEGGDDGGLHSNTLTNECLNIFVQTNLTRTNVRIYS